MELIDPLPERVQLLVAEYSGALAPGRVIAIAESTAAALLRLREPTCVGEDFLVEWRDSARRRLSEEVVRELMGARRSEFPDVA